MIDSLRKKSSAAIAAIAVSVVALAAFFYGTGLAFKPLILFGVTLFLLHPYRKESSFAARLHTLIIITFALWLIFDLQWAMLPFLLAFLLAYLLDPLVSYMTEKGSPRWLNATAVMIILLTTLISLGVFIFPVIFSQLDDVQAKVGILVGTTTNYLESRSFYKTMAQYGIPTETLRQLVKDEFIPRIQGFSNLGLNSITNLLRGASDSLTQVINVIIVPILAFYILKDMPVFKDYIRGILWRRNKEVFRDIVKINQIIKAYIGGQVISATFIAVSTTILFAIFGIPYSIFLGLLAGLFNPIPYVGMLISTLVAVLTVLIVNTTTDHVMGPIVSIIIITNGLHFLNAYFIEPRIVGERVGLHPVILIASLFIFGHFFGILGLLVAVPITASIMMFVNDWRKRNNMAIHRAHDEEDIIEEEMVEKGDIEKVR
ncbi:MAG: AI-2E family transporter [Bacteroidota bacterium]